MEIRNRNRSILTVRLALCTLISFFASYMFVTYTTRVSLDSQVGITSGHGRALNQSWPETQIILIPTAAFILLQAAVLFVCFSEVPRKLMWLLALQAVACLCVGSLRLMFAYD